MSSTECCQRRPHMALIPSAGMGHLAPFLRLASMLLSRNCLVTLVTAKSTVSAAESNHISFFLVKYPEIKHIELQVVPIHPLNPADNDPFFLQFRAVDRSLHVIHPLLSSSSDPPLSAIFCDLTVARSTAPIAADLGIPFYVIITTSAKFFCFMLHLPFFTSNPDKFSTDCTEVEIPGLTSLPISSIPRAFLNPNNLAAIIIMQNLEALAESKGILINTFHWFEEETLAALNNGRVLSNLPPVFPIGPLKHYELEKDQSQYIPWLDNQPAESVVYVSFGSRTAMSTDQIRELRNGIDKSGCRFLWVVKTNKVDKEDEEDLEVLLGGSFLERTKNKGMAVKGWVNQQQILSHPAIAAFVSHCGWNSVMEAAQLGIPILAWPLHGDQRVNAEIVEKAGLGISDTTLGMGSERLVQDEEISKKIREFMECTMLRSRARSVGEEARKATVAEGSSDKVITGVIEKLS